MSAEELFGTLTRPNESYLGSYASFLNHELPGRLRPADLLVALAWVESQQSRHDMSYRLAELMDQIMLRAWEHLDVPSVREAFARAALARLRQYDEIVQEKTSAFAVSEEPSFSERVVSDDQKRRSLVEEMLELLQAKEDDAWLLVHYKTPLLLKKDAAWLIEKLEGETSDRKRAVLATLLRRAFYGWDDEQHEIVYLAYQRNPALADEVGNFFDPIELSSELAQEQRRYHRESRSWREKREEPPSPDPPLAERIQHALDDIEAGDVDAFWQRLDYYLKFEENGRSRTSPTEWDLTELPGWNAADAATRDRIIGTAKRYLLEGEPRTDGWLGEGVIWETHPADAGYRALRLLVNLAPNFVADMPDETWERWVAVILDYPLSTGTEEKEPHLELVAMAYRHAPDVFIDALLFLVERRMRIKATCPSLATLRSAGMTGWLGPC